MAFIKTPDGGFYLSDTQFNVDYLKNNITIKTSEIPVGDYLPLAGGKMEADAVIEGIDELQIVVGDDSVAGAVGVTSEGVTLTRTNNGASASLRLIDDAVEIVGGDTTITINGTGINMGDNAISGLTSLGGNGAEIAIENQVDMNNHKITMLAEPTDTQDATTKNYVDNKALEERLLPRLRDLFGVPPLQTVKFELPEPRESLLVVFYSVDPTGNTNIANSRAITVQAGATQSRDNLTVTFDSNGQTIVFESTEDTNSLLGQYYSYNSN